MRIGTATATTAIAAALVFALAGCTPPPAPEPTPTPAFSSEDEAFAAAEATYRAYVDALNQRNANANATPAPTDFLIGEALTAELETQRLLDEQHRSIVGLASPSRFAGVSTADEHERVSATVCLDVSDSRVIDADGNDVTPTDRPDVLALEIDFVTVGDELAITRSTVAGEQTC